MSTAVLHVDDDPAFLGLSDASIARLDDSIDLTTATNADDATELLAAREFDCVVSDYVTATDGTAFVETVGQGHPGTPLILLSGKRLDELPDQTVRSYLTDAILKGDGDVFADLVGRIHDYADERPARSTREAFMKGATESNTTIRLLDVNDDPTVQFLELLAELQGSDVTSLPPLFERLDADLLDALFDQASAGADPGVELRFRYAGFDVLLNSDGTVFLHDLNGRVDDA